MQYEFKKCLDRLFHTFFSFFIVLLIILNPKIAKVRATEIIFQENFDDDSSFSNIATVSAQGSVMIDNLGFLSLSAPFGRKFPVIALNQALPDDSYSIEIRFRYPIHYNFGTGVILSDHYPIADVAMTLEDPIYYIWADTSGLQARYLTNTGAMTSPIYYYENKYDWHVLKYERQGDKNKYFFDDDLITAVNTNRQPEFIWFGSPHFTNTNDNWSPINIDYVRVSEISEDSLPSWYMSQRDPLWKDNEYDHANSWNPGGVNTIERYGCAMTSAAMIMGKSGIQEIDLSNIDPGELNAWLISQKDGYLGNGLTNWIAIARHVKEVVTDENKNKLEFNRAQATKEKVDELLSAGFYAIVNLGGHFVVIYDTKDNDNWLIADPYVADHTTLPKTTNLVSVSYYSPSKTDLSYFLFTSNPNVNIQLTDSYGHLIPLIRTVESIKDEVTGISSPELAIYTLAKPITGKYIMDINSDGPGVVEVYLYDTVGEVTTQSINVDNKETIIDFDKSDVDKSIITIPDTILPDIAINTPPLTNKRIIWGTATDNLGLRKVEIAIMPKLWWKVFHNYWTNTYGTNDWKMFLPYFPDDSYRVRARSIDLSNNISKVVEKYITLDTTSPKVWGDIAKIGSKRNVRLEASDKNGIEKIEFKWDKTKNWETYQSPMEINGRILYYRAKDMAGNISSVKSMYVR